MPEEKLSRRKMLAGVLGAGALAVAGCSPTPQETPTTTVEKIDAKRLSSGYKLVFAAAARSCGEDHNLDAIRHVEQKFPTLDVVAINTFFVKGADPLPAYVPGRHTEFEPQEAVASELAKYGLTVIEKRVALVKPDKSYILLDSKDPNFLSTIANTVNANQAAPQR